MYTPSPYRLHFVLLSRELGRSATDHSVTVKESIVYYSMQASRPERVVMIAHDKPLRNADATTAPATFWSRLAATGGVSPHFAMCDICVVKDNSCRWPVQNVATDASSLMLALRCTAMCYRKTSLAFVISRHSPASAYVGCVCVHQALPRN
jgi:hypothetical protein